MEIKVFPPCVRGRRERNGTLGDSVRFMRVFWRQMTLQA
jgi:hypothetical protein